MALALAALEWMARALFPSVVFVGESASLRQPGKFGSSYGYKPRARGVSWGDELLTDDLGFRLDPDAPRPNAARPALVLLGDSVTLGIGVPVPETFAGRLRRRFPARGFINAAATAYGATDYLNVVRHFVIPRRAELRIDSALLLLTLNDVADPMQSPVSRQLERERYRGVARLARALDRGLGANRYLAARSKLYLLVKAGAYDLSRSWFRADAQLYDDRDRVRRFAGEVALTRSLLTDAGVRVGVAILPYEYQLREPEAARLEPQRRLAAALAEAGISADDLSEPLRVAMARRGLSSRSLFLFNDHCHLSAQGHALVFEQLARMVAAPAGAARHAQTRSTRATSPVGQDAVAQPSASRFVLDLENHAIGVGEHGDQTVALTVVH